MAEHNALGEEGEAEARFYLMMKGYSLLDCNWRYGKLEIDIIAEWHGEIVFVEVKTRRDEHFAAAKDAVTLLKQRNIVAAGRAYLAQHNLYNKAYSFDIITVVGTHHPFEITHYRNAYREDEVWEKSHYRSEFEV